MEVGHGPLTSRHVRTGEALARALRVSAKPIWDTRARWTLRTAQLITGCSGLWCRWASREDFLAARVAFKRSDILRNLGVRQLLDMRLWERKALL